MRHDPEPDDEFSRLLRRIVFRATFDPADLTGEGGIRRPRWPTVTAHAGGTRATGAEA